MSNRYTVAPGQEFNYPADPISEGIIKNAGGRSQLSDADRARVKFKTVVAGEDCSDMPESALKLYVSRGWVIEETVEKVWEDLGRPATEVTNE